MSSESLAIQFTKSMENRTRLVPAAAAPTAELIANRMKEQSLEGRAFGNDRYDDEYVERYARRRQRRGLSTYPVEMRAGKKRIEKTRIEFTAGTGATIRFDDPEMAVVFRYHQEGITYSKAGFRQRSLFPASADSIDESLRRTIKELVFETMTK